MSTIFLAQTKRMEETKEKQKHTKKNQVAPGQQTPLREREGGREGGRGRVRRTWRLAEGGADKAEYDDAHPI